MALTPKIAILQPIVCVLVMGAAVISGNPSTIRPVLLLTALSSLALGFSLARWPVPEVPRWQIWPMVRSWLGLVLLALFPLAFGYVAPIKGAGALALISLLPAEVARWAGSYRYAMTRLQ